MRRLIAVSLLLAGVATVASARLAVPEIDPGSVVTVSALVGCGLLMIGRRRK